MSENAPPRKKRFLSSARNKLASLLRRRELTSNSTHNLEDLDEADSAPSDIEDDTPILSQLPSPNKTADSHEAKDDSVKRLRRQGVIEPYQLTSQASGDSIPSGNSFPRHQSNISSQNSTIAPVASSQVQDHEVHSSTPSFPSSLDVDVQPEKQPRNQLPNYTQTRAFIRKDEGPLMRDSSSQTDDAAHIKYGGAFRPTVFVGTASRPLWATNLPLHATKRQVKCHQSLTSSGSNELAPTPESSPNSPNCITNAYLSEQTSSLSLKRKRPANTTLAPPPYIHQHTGWPDFNVFTNGILLYPELVLEFAQHLPIKTLISLYAISRDFHTIVDYRMISVVLSQGLRKCEEGIRAWPWRFFDDLCQDNPRSLTSKSDESLDDQRGGAASKSMKRRVPTLRYLNFIMHRAKVVQELFAFFAQQGVPLPERCRIPIAKMWLMFDIPHRSHRIGYAHSKLLVSDEDLYLMMTFIVRLDMVLLDPVASEKRDGLRKMLFSDLRGLEGMLYVLKRTGARSCGALSWGSRDQSELLQLWVRNGMFEQSDMWRSISDLDKQGIKKIFGVPIEEAGAMNKEFWGAANPTPGRHAPHLLRPDQLVQYELIHRGLKCGQHLIESLLFGYVGSDGLSAREPQYVSTQIAGLEDEEYDLNDEVGGLQALSIEDGGDPLLDLGETARTGASRSRSAPPSRVVVRATQQEKEMTAGFITAWKVEAGLV